MTRNAYFKPENPETYLGRDIGGAICVGITEMSDPNGRIYLWKCPYCGNTFGKSVKLLRLMTRNNEKVDCGCRAHIRYAERNIKRSTTGGVFSYGDPETRRIAENVKNLVARVTDPKSRHYENYGGRTYGRPIGFAGDWDTGDRGTTIRLIVQWFIDSGWTRDCGLSIDRINTNGDYCPENCKLATPEEQNDNQLRTSCYQYGNRVFVGSKAKELFGYSASKVANDRLRDTTSMSVYEKEHPGVTLHKDSRGAIRDQDGFVRIVPTSHAFPLYPDNWKDKVHNWNEYVERLRINMQERIPTRIYINWITNRFLRELGINPDDEMLIKMSTGNGFRYM